MDFAAKRRVRINGTLTATDGGVLQVDVAQAYGNCPQYIHPRRISCGKGLLPQPIPTSSAATVIACRRHCADPFGGHLLPGHHSSRARQRRVASRRSGGIRAGRRHHRRVAGLPGQQHVQQLRQSRDRPDRRAAVHRLRQRAHASAVGPGGRRLGESARGDTGRWVRFTADSVVGSRRSPRCDESCGRPAVILSNPDGGGLLVRSVTYSMSISLDGYIVGPDGSFDWADARRGGLSLRHRRDTGRRRSPDGTAALRNDAVLGEPPSRIRRSTRRSSSGPRSGSRSRRWCSPRRCRRCRAMPAWLRAAWRRRSSGCEPSRGRATSRSAVRLSPPRQPRWV